MLSDIFIITGFGLIGPILAIFIKDNLTGGTLFAAGFASTLFLIVKSITQLPLSRYTDSHDDKIKLMVIGTVVIALVPFIYIFASHIWHIFVAQAIYGIGAALAFPTWISLFTTHLDKKKEGFEFSIYSTCVGIGTAISASIGAILAKNIGFDLTFLIVGIMSVIGCLILLGLEKGDGKQKLVIMNKSKLVTHHHYR